MRGSFFSQLFHCSIVPMFQHVFGIFAPYTYRLKYYFTKLLTQLDFIYLVYNKLTANLNELAGFLHELYRKMNKTARFFIKTKSVNSCITHYLCMGERKDQVCEVLIVTCHLSLVSLFQKTPFEFCYKRKDVYFCSELC